MTDLQDLRSIASHSPIEHARRLAAQYGGGRPLGGYAVLAGVYSAVTAVGVASAALRGRVAEPRFSDGALLAVGAFKLSRILTKDKITGFARAPFTTFEEMGDGPEVNESPRGRGLRLAIGEMLTCPFCLNQWSATVVGLAWLHAPTATRLATAMLAATAGADVLHVGWTRLESLA